MDKYIRKRESQEPTKEVLEMVKKVNDWLSTTEGQDEINKSIQECHERIEQREIERRKFECDLINDDTIYGI